MIQSVFKILMILQVLFSATSFAETIVQNDAEGDVQLNLPEVCQHQPSDIVSTSLHRENSDYVVEMAMSQPINPVEGYKEYYFWLDLNHDGARGYRPSLSQSVTWPDLLANYKVFYSLDAGVVPPFTVPKERIRLQNCHETNCAFDSDLRSSEYIAVDITDNVISFRWPVGLLPELEKSKNIRVGYSAYYELMECNGEDNSPEWGEPAFQIKKPKNESSAL